jgi:prophage regulatory protein
MRHSDLTATPVTGPRMTRDAQTSTSAQYNPERKRFLRLHRVKETTGLSRTSIYRKIAAREFPSPIRIGARSVAWVEAEVIQWMNNCEELSRSGQRAG